jgi:phosphatidylserine/phosphatidylglycerophosphate/cardiolipin synthase-like enzyme
VRTLVLFSAVFAAFFGACATAELKEPPPPVIFDSGVGVGVTSDGGGDGTTGDDAAHPDGSGGNDGSPPPVDAGQLAYTSAVQIIVEPSDKGQALLSAIQGAKTSVHMTMYLLSNDQVVSALIAQKNAGHEVKVVLNQTFPDTESNATVFGQLKNAGVSVVYAPAVYTFTHEKCVIIDGTTAWIMTMNATQSSPTDNREYLAVDTDSADVAAAEAVFEADYGNLAVNTSGKLLLAPVNAKERILSLIGSATKTIDLEGEELSDTDVVAALTARADAGVKIRIVLAGAGTASQQQAITTLKAKSIPVVSIANPYVHAKAIVVDAVHAYVGSENFSTGSLKYNRELGVVFDTAAEVSKVATTIGGDFGKGTPL